jgi:hypothetical protein
MANPQNFLDNLKNLGIVMPVALEHTQDNLDQFTTNGTLYEVRQAESSVYQNPNTCGSITERTRCPRNLNQRGAEFITS